MFPINLPCRVISFPSCNLADVKSNEISLFSVTPFVRRKNVVSIKLPSAKTSMVLSSFVLITNLSISYPGDLKSVTIALEIDRSDATSKTPLPCKVPIMASSISILWTELELKLNEASTSPFSPGILAQLNIGKSMAASVKSTLALPPPILFFES